MSTVYGSVHVPTIQIIDTICVPVTRAIGGVLGYLLYCVDYMQPDKAMDACRRYLARAGYEPNHRQLPSSSFKH